MNNNANIEIITETTGTHGQHTDHEWVVRDLDSGAVLRVKLHADRSYKHQCRAAVEIFDRAQPIELCTLGHDDWSAREPIAARDELIRRGVDVAYAVVYD